MQNLQMPEEAPVSLERELQAAVSHLTGCWDLNPGLLEAPPVLLTPEPTPRPYAILFLSPLFAIVSVPVLSWVMSNL